MSEENALSRPSEQYEAIVVGGGPAGSAAARVLALRGVRVLVLDKARFPRPKLCGGLLTQKTMRLLARLFAPDFAATSEELLARGLVHTVSHGYAIACRERVMLEGEAAYPFHLVDRSVFDASLLDKAREAGATVIEDAAVVECDPARARVVCRDGRSFTAPRLIAADGANSLVRRHCRVDPKAWRANLAATIEIAVPQTSLPRPVTRPTLHTGFVRAGYCWAFPHREKALIGVCNLTRAQGRLSDHFREYLAFLGLPPALPLPAFKGHPLPYGNYLEHPAFASTLLAGDAAGLVEPLFGEGIYYALRSGEAAALATLEGLSRSGDPARTYLDLLHREIFPEFRFARRLRAALYFTEKHFRFRPIGCFLKTLEPLLVETIHGARSFRWLRRQSV